MEVLVDLFFRYWEITVFIVSATFAFSARSSIYTYFFGIQKYIYGIFYRFDLNNKKIEVLLIKLNPKYKFHTGWAFPYAPYGVDKFKAFTDLSYSYLQFPHGSVSVPQDIVEMPPRYPTRHGLRKLGPKKQYSAIFSFVNDLPPIGDYAVDAKFHSIAELENIITEWENDPKAKWLKSYKIILKDLKADEQKFIYYNERNIKMEKSSI